MAETARFCNSSSDIGAGAAVSSSLMTTVACPPSARRVVVVVVVVAALEVEGERSADLRFAGCAMTVSCLTGGINSAGSQPSEPLGCGMTKSFGMVG